MVTQKIKSRIDQTLDTSVDRKLLVAGEVVTVKFQSEQQMQSFAQIGVIDLVDPAEPDRKVIPVIGARPIVDDVIMREIVVPNTFSLAFVLEEHLRNGV